MEDPVTDNSATAVSSGTASEAMVKAAEAASSPAPTPASLTAGDTTSSASANPTGATPAATAPAAAVGSPESASGTRGPIPFDRHEAALRNARSEVEARYAWTQGINPRDVGAAMSLLTDLRRAPSAFWEKLGAELKAKAPASEQDAPFSFPDGDLRTEDGKASAYSTGAVQKILGSFKQEVMREFMGQMQPMMQHFQSEQTRQQTEQVRQQSVAIATDALTNLRAFPHFKENEKAIGERLLAMDPRVKAQIGPVAALYRAYNEHLTAAVFPTIDSTAEQRVRDIQQRKAATTRGQAHPTDQTGATSKPELRTVSDLARHLSSLEAAASA